MIKTILLSLSSFFLLGCTTSSKIASYPKMYEEKPASILIYPVINNTTDADAPLFYPTTLAESVGNAGYYIFPIEITNDFFQGQGIISGEQLREVKPSMMYDYFGADAVLRITINKWDTSYVVISSSVTVKLVVELISTKTSDIIWLQNRELTVSSGDGGGSLLGALISAAINAAATDYIDIAKKLNKNVYASIPFGKYHRRHLRDQEDFIHVDSTKKDKE